MNLPYKKNDNVFIFNSKSLLLGTVGKCANTIDYSMDLDTIRKQEIDLIASLLRIDRKNILMLNQVHGDRIIEMNTPCDADRIFPDADGMISSNSNLCIVIRTADCVPVFIIDEKQKIFGAVHSGWKGCSFNITGKLIKIMKTRFKSKPDDLHAYILPSIGPDSYTVNMDVGSLFKNDIIIKNKKINLSLWNNIAGSLLEQGLPDSNINQSGICTCLKNSDFFSYRCSDSGRNLNFAIIKNPNNKSS